MSGGRIASRSEITYVAGLSPYPAARSGSRTERAECGRSFAIAPSITAGAHSEKSLAPGLSGMVVSPSSAKIHHSGGGPPRASSMLVPAGIANAHT